ncbi:MAG: DNA-directed RNA polymerase subunit omega [Clostridiales bacterium]|jgi:DNA-directed RNA polymerase omega subunit|nr:DNA-directed RNA polymerase subunit omega [Clostridiales bacterium]
MMIDPPIDKLIEKADCRYALVCAISKRVSAIITQEPEYLRDSGDKPVTLAAKEIYNDKIRIVEEE